MIQFFDAGFIFTGVAEEDTRLRIALLGQWQTAFEVVFRLIIPLIRPFLYVAPFYSITETPQHPIYGFLVRNDTVYDVIYDVSLNILNLIFAGLH